MFILWEPNDPVLDTYWFPSHGRSQDKIYISRTIIIKDPIPRPSTEFRNSPAFKLETTKRLPPVQS
jgi:hypothetical protein